MRRILDQPWIYAAWQYPFVAQKLEPFHRHNDVAGIGSALDIGCGPGTNAEVFAHARYLGVDLDPAYVARATERFGPHFRVGNASALEVADFAPVDALLVNSLCHHLTDAQLTSLLGRHDLVNANGRLHLIDLYLPGSGIPERLARADRGEHARSLPRLRGMIEENWTIEIEEPFWLTLAGVRLWAMVYFRATARR